MYQQEIGNYKSQEDNGWFVSISHSFSMKLNLDLQIGKAWDTFAPIGPAIVSGIADPHNLDIKCVVNGTTVQESNTKHMIFKVDELIAYISTVMTLNPGDLIFTGTPPGVGIARTPPLFLNKGDTVVVSIQGFDPLENTVSVD